MDIQRENIVSVYIVNRNYGRYIEKSIESVLKQTFKQWELIIIDDGSKDNSKQIIEKYKILPRVTVVYQENKGLNVSNNVALRLANGQYIMRVDADDYLDENALSIMFQKMETKPELALVFPIYYVIDEHDNIISIVRRHEFRDGKVTLFDQPAHGACTMIRKSVLKDIGGYSELYRCQDGVDIWLKIVGKYKVENINLPLFYYRKHSANLTKKEGLIYRTHSLIINEHAKTLNIQKKNNICIIPLRSSLEGVSLLKKFAHTTLLDIALRAALEVSNISKIVVSTPDQLILDYVNRHYSHYRRKMIKDKRPTSLCGVNTYIEPTIEYILNEYRKILKKPDSITLLYTGFPFIDSIHLNKAINMLYLFEADCIIAVKGKNKLYYKHNGHGLTLLNVAYGILQLEREIIYEDTGLLRVVSYDYFEREKSVLGRKIGHVLLDDLAGMSIENDKDFAIGEFLAKNHYRPSIPK